MTVLLSSVTTVSVGASVDQEGSGLAVYQAILSNTTTPTATVLVEGSITGDHWITIGTITLSGALDTDGFVLNAPWPHIRGNVTGITGVSASVSLLMSEG